MKELSIVMIAPQSWDYEIGSNARNIAIEFSKRFKVIYVDPPRDWISVIKHFVKPSMGPYHKSGLSAVNENIWNLKPSHLSASINWIGSERIYNFMNRRNNKKFADSIRECLHRLEVNDFIVFNDNYMFNGLFIKEMLKPKYYIYYIRDYLLVQPYFARHGIRIEPELIKKSDAVVANSLYLKEYAQQYNKNSFYVGQGCDIEMFDEGTSSERPSDLKKITSPVVGYIGFLTAMRLDIQLLIEIAERNLHWSIVLVGPEDEAFRNSRLHKLENVYFLGRKEPSQLPVYLKAFDVCINPQAINPLTIGNYPRKIDEYLAMGKPTVATATKAMEVFAECTYLASDKEEFIKFIEVALRERDPNLKSKRIALAKSHTWENSVNEIYKAMATL